MSRTVEAIQGTLSFEDEATLQARFEAFDRQNPTVFQEFKRLACEAKAAGRTRIGAKQIAEVLRWNVALRRTGDDYKLNNSYISRYARKLVREDPSFAGLFEFRSLRAYSACHSIRSARLLTAK